MGDSAASQLLGGRKACRAAADDEDLGIHGG